MDKEVTTALWILTIFILKGVLAGHWSVNLPINPICAVIGSTVVLPCSYEYQEDSSSQPLRDGDAHSVRSEMWCLGSSRCITPSYVYHSDGVFLDPSYSNRVMFLGQTGTKNCSLQISGVRMSDGGAYVFYVIPDPPTQKMPAQTGVQLLVAGSPDAVTASVNPCGGALKGAPLQLACCGPPVGPVGRYRWLMDPAGDSTTQREHPGQVWTMDETRADASGNYVCQVQSAEGWRSSANITVDVQYPPCNTSVHVTSVDVLSSGTGVVLTCSSDANPPVESYTWFRGNGCLTAVDRRTGATPMGPTLKLHADPPTGESELYCCVAANTLGSQSYNVTLYGGVNAGEPQLARSKRVMIVATTTVTLLVVIGLVAFALRWKLKESPLSQSYGLAGTTVPVS
ncbi:unnamed protein product [Gadus morhua 'NCC']